VIVGLVIVGLLFGGGFYYGVQNEKHHANDRAIASLELSCITNNQEWRILADGRAICVKKGTVIPSE
jgi:hypothetical protein